LGDKEWAHEYRQAAMQQNRLTALQDFYDLNALHYGPDPLPDDVSKQLDESTKKYITAEKAMELDHANFTDPLKSATSDTKDIAAQKDNIDALYQQAGAGLTPQAISQTAQQLAQNPVAPEPPLGVVIQPDTPESPTQNKPKPQFDLPENTNPINPDDNSQPKTKLGVLAKTLKDIFKKLTTDDPEKKYDPNIPKWRKYKDPWAAIFDFIEKITGGLIPLGTLCDNLAKVPPEKWEAYGDWCRAKKDEYEAIKHIKETYGDKGERKAAIKQVREETRERVEEINQICEQKIAARKGKVPKSVKREQRRQAREQRRQERAQQRAARNPEPTPLIEQDAPSVQINTKEGLVREIQNLNQDAKIKANLYGDPVITSEIPLKDLTLPKGFELDENNNVTNKNNAIDGNVISIAAQDRTMMCSTREARSNAHEAGRTAPVTDRASVPLTPNLNIG